MVKTFLLTIGTVALACAATSDAAPDRDLFDLNKGDSVHVRSGDGREHVIKFIDLVERTEPYFESATKKSVDAVVSAEITVEVDGARKTFTGGPFRMPVTLNGFAFLLGSTRNWSGGYAKDPLAKDIRLEIRDASTPWVAPDRFVFPIRNYRWRVMNYQHTYLGVVVNQARLYYHRGEDMGMIPDLEHALAMERFKVVKTPGPKGDGASNSVVLDDTIGLSFRYAHMNTPNILPEVRPDAWINQGQALGLTGNTWRGGPVNDPHLHVQATDPRKGDVFRNTFPMFVAAYRKSFPGEPMPIAGGWRHLFAGESLTLDGSLSLAGTGRKIESYAWEFTDGSRAAAASAKRTYAHPGTYSERLTVTDDKGRSDSDFVEVFVLSRDQKQPPPFAWVNYYPIRGIRPGTEVRFLIRYSNMGDLKIDFGDGTSIPYAENSTHKFAKAGTYIVTVSGADSGSGPGILHARVIVEP
jgi:hypothetical protein